MPSKLNPYISLKNTAREAIIFYQSALGGKLTMSTFGESGMSKDTLMADKIMHAQLIADNGMTLMASDTPEGMEYVPGSNVQISLSGDNEMELKGYWDKLSEGGTISVPMSKAPWGDMFGMFTDKFGIHWLVNITAKK